jgi:hypothetical protein
LQPAAGPTCSAAVLAAQQIREQLQLMRTKRTAEDCLRLGDVCRLLMRCQSVSCLLLLTTGCCCYQRCATCGCVLAGLKCMQQFPVVDDMSTPHTDSIKIWPALVVKHGRAHQSECCHSVRSWSEVDEQPGRQLAFERPCF